MSHTTSIRGIKIMDVNALRNAITELSKTGVKIELIPNATPRAFYANQEGLGQADYVAKLADASYDIGFYKQPDGSYEPRTDFWGGSVERVLGAKATKAENTEQAKLGKLIQMYGAVAAMDKARKQGLSVRKQVTTDGTIKVIVEGFA